MGAVYLDPDALQLVLRLTYGTRRLLAMIIFDTAHVHDWQMGDLVDADPGAMSRAREVEYAMGMTVSEEDYILTNRRTGGKAIIRKNDWLIGNRRRWLKDLMRLGRGLS